MKKIRLWNLQSLNLLQVSESKSNKHHADDDPSLLVLPDGSVQVICLDGRAPSQSPRLGPGPSSQATSVPLQAADVLRQFPAHSLSCHAASASGYSGSLPSTHLLAPGQTYYLVPLEVGPVDRPALRLPQHTGSQAPSSFPYHDDNHPKLVSSQADVTVAGRSQRGLRRSFHSPPVELYKGETSAAEGPYGYRDVWAGERALPRQQNDSRRASACMARSVGSLSPGEVYCNGTTGERQTWTADVPFGNHHDRDRRQVSSTSTSRTPQSWCDSLSGTGTFSRSSSSRSSSNGCFIGLEGDNTTTAPASGSARYYSDFHIPLAAVTARTPSPYKPRRLSLDSMNMRPRPASEPADGYTGGQTHRSGTNRAGAAARALFSSPFAYRRSSNMKAHAVQCLSVDERPSGGRATSSGTASDARGRFPRNLTTQHCGRRRATAQASDLTPAGCGNHYAGCQAQWEGDGREGPPLSASMRRRILRRLSLDGHKAASVVPSAAAAAAAGSNANTAAATNSPATTDAVAAAPLPPAGGLVPQGVNGGDGSKGRRAGRRSCVDGHRGGPGGAAGRSVFASLSTADWSDEALPLSAAVGASSSQARQQSMTPAQSGRWSRRYSLDEAKPAARAAAAAALRALTALGDMSVGRPPLAPRC